MCDKLELFGLTSAFLMYVLLQHSSTLVIDVASWVSGDCGQRKLADLKRNCLETSLVAHKEITGK